jgi:translation initiation factor 3 subunit A
VFLFQFQASCIFKSIKIDMLSRMIPFFDFSVVEKISVDAAKQNFVAIKVDHLSGVVQFGTVVCGPYCVHQF